MALVSGGKSTLNPNAPLYIPAAVRQVEDFSPEWYELITTSTWFRDYWLNEHQESDMFYSPEDGVLANRDVVDLLPDDIDLGLEEDFSYLESEFQEFAQAAENQVGRNLGMSGASFPAGSKFADIPIKGN